MGVAVVTDSAAALPVDLVERYGITVVPMWLTFGGTLTRDDHVAADEVFAHDEVSTSGPSPGEFASAIESRASEAGVLVLTIAGTMSSTFAAAQQGAASVATPVVVLDTSTAAGAEALVVLEAARVAEGGATLREVQDAATRTIAAVRLVAMVPDLDRLARSGRVPAAAGWAGRRLRLRPLFEFRDGKARPLRPALNVDAAKERMVGMLQRSRRPGARLHVAVLHANAPDEAQDLLRRVEAVETPATWFVGPFSTVMVAHTGPGLAGLAWWWESPADPTEIRPAGR